MRVSRSRQAGPPQKPAAPRRRRRKAPGCASLLALLLAVVVALVLFTDARLTRIDALPDQRIKDTSGTNWLLVGSDSRQGLSEKDAERLGTGGDIGSTRTDTIMLLHLPRTGEATLVSIPRDSYVEIPGYGTDKINAAFSYGGPKLLAQTVEKSTGLRVDRYAEIGMGGLAGVVDAVGGVDVCVSEPIDDPLAHINVQPGCQKMDGPTGLGYVRTRATAQGDLDRVQRQRDFLGSLVHKATSPAVLANPFRAIPLVLALPKMFTVNTSDHVWNLARIALAMRGGLKTETIPLGGFEDTEVGNVLLWDDNAAEALFSSLR
ncbi:LCP family protein [Corynebacterium sp. UBA2622]|uniref:LCP family protein n=1 Tax=Corynebacterium sp. UBA2622 TaxID=1946393 RepID=UPI0025C58C05|nr:LCP family protein [Corynebacterium sp. UBA2622]